MTFDTFLQGLGLGEKVAAKALAPAEIDRLKAEAEEIADKAISGYLAAKKKKEKRIEAQQHANAHKRKGPEPEELSERLRAIRESLSQQGPGSQ